MTDNPSAVGAEILTQDEVDALLKGVHGENDAPEATPAPGGVRPYNLATQERIVRARMPTLEIINDRFARLLRVAIFNFMRRSPEVTFGPARLIKYGDFTRDLAVPANLNLVQVRPLRGNALIVLDPTLIYQIVDNLFGGDGRFHTRVEGRDFTPTELRITQKLLAVLMTEYQQAWQKVFPLTFEYVRSEMHTQFVNIASANDVVVVSSFAIDLGGGGGSIHFCIPYSTLEPIRDVIYGAMQGDQAEPDKRWARGLMRQIQSADVEVRAKLATTSMQIGELLAKQVGDVIPIEIGNTIPAEVEGIPMLECRYGVRNGHYALQVERMTLAPDETTAGGSHA